jgi:hypothetical protein
VFTFTSLSIVTKVEKNLPKVEKKKTQSEKKASRGTKKKPTPKVEEFIAEQADEQAAKQKRELIIAGKIKPLYCDVCGRVSKREFVGEWKPSDKPKEGEPTQDDGVAKYWLRCADCAIGAVQLVEEWKIQTEREKNLDELTREECIVYTPQAIYAVGDPIFHEGLKEIGIVRSKVTTSSGMSAINVEFRNLGFRQLLENVYIDADGTVSEGSKKGKLKIKKAKK